MSYKALIAGVVLTGLAPWMAIAEEAHNGGALFAEHCAECHNGTVSKAPPINMLGMFSASAVLRAMDTGVMQSQAGALNDAQRQTVAEFITGKQLADEVVAEPPQCTDKRVSLTTEGALLWGVDEGNGRNFSAYSDLAIDDLADMQLAWVYAFPGAARIRSQPAVTGNSVIIGSQSGAVTALDRETGCVRWTFSASAEVRTAIVVSAADADGAENGRQVFFGDLVGNVYALDALTGALIWRDRPDPHPSLTITAAPTLHGDTLYVPLSSLEVVAAADPNYACCTFRGAVVAYDAQTGSKRWTGYTIDKPVSEVARNAVGVPIYAPSGAPVWGTPVIDIERNQLYVGTGESYSSPAGDTSDAIIAMSLEDGSINWRIQATPRDAWNIACEMEDRTNCPYEDGPDYDFGAATLLTQDVNGKDVLIAGQKSGAVFGIEPDSGKLRWKNKLGRGGIQGGVHFGMAADGHVVYVPMSDFYGGPRWPGRAYPGMFAIDATTGEKLWYTENPDICEGRAFCDPGLSAAASAIADGVVSGSMDGRLRAYDKATGKVVWEYDSVRQYDGIGGMPGSGGSFGGAAGPVFYGSMMFATSGYGLYEHMPGNVLLAFKRRGSDLSSVGK